MISFALNRTLSSGTFIHVFFPLGFLGLGPCHSFYLRRTLMNNSSALWNSASLTSRIVVIGGVFHV